MKAFILLGALVAACVDGNPNVCVYHAEVGHHIVSCHQGWQQACGMDLRECEDGEAYVCVQNVSRSSGCPR